MLILVRHGESRWNAADRFTGWVDVALTEAGREEARAAGRQLREEGITPSVVHTSLLRRAIDTAELMLDVAGGPPVSAVRTADLNERHYGALQGLTRPDAVRRYGDAQVARWRRSVTERPPVDEWGMAESLADVRERVRPYLEQTLFPALSAGHRVLVVTHGNTIRMLVQLLERISDDDAGRLDIPTGQPRFYDHPPTSLANGLIVGP